MSNPLTSRGVHIPPELLYCPKIAPALRDTWGQIRGLADESGRLELKNGIQELAAITSKSTATLYGHLAALRDMQALKWSASRAGDLVVVFDDKSFQDYLSKILNTLSLDLPAFNNISRSREGFKEHLSKISESKRDPLLEHPAVKIYRGVMHVTANELQRKTIVDIIAYEIPKWQECLEHWRLHGWSPTNVTGMLDSFKRGGKAACSVCQRNGSKPPAPAPPDDSLAAEIARRKAKFANGK